MSTPEPSPDWRRIADDLAQALDLLDALYQSEYDPDVVVRPEWLQGPRQRYWHAAATSGDNP